MAKKQSYYLAWCYPCFTHRSRQIFRLRLKIFNGIQGYSYPEIVNTFTEI